MDRQANHQYWFDWCWQMDYSVFSGHIPLPSSSPEPCPGQKLDRHSTIKPNEECAFNEEGEGLWWGVDYTSVFKSVTHAGTQTRIEMHMQENKQAHAAQQNAHKARGYLGSKVLRLGGIASEK